MNISTSEYSSGCESGWTMYLDQLSNSTTSFYQEKGTFQKEEEEDEDLSMVSDASSGPPHYQDYACTSQDSKNQHHKVKTKEPTSENHHNLCLDDTASSPFFNFSMGNVPTSDDHNSVEAFPAAHFKRESKAKEHLNLFKSSTKGKSGSLLGRKRH